MGGREEGEGEGEGERREGREGGGKERGKRGRGERGRWVGYERQLEAEIVTSRTSPHESALRPMSTYSLPVHTILSTIVPFLRTCMNSVR